MRTHLSLKYPVDIAAARQVQHQAEATPDLKDTQAPGLREALWIWGVLGVLTLAVFTTYATTPVSELYRVSIEGIAGGASQALVLLNYPIAFMAIALMGIAVTRLFAVPGALTRYERWLVGALALIATAMVRLTRAPHLADHPWQVSGMCRLGRSQYQRIQEHQESRCSVQNRGGLSRAP